MISLLSFKHLFIFNVPKYRWILQQQDRYYFEHETEQWTKTGWKEPQWLSRAEQGTLANADHSCYLLFLLFRILTSKHSKHLSKFSAGRGRLLTRSWSNLYTGCSVRVGLTRSAMRRKSMIWKGAIITGKLFRDTTLESFNLELGKYPIFGWTRVLSHSLRPVWSSLWMNLIVVSKN